MGKRTVALSKLGKVGWTTIGRQYILDKLLGSKTVIFTGSLGVSTLTRASSATYTASSTYLSTAATDAARFECSPTTGAVRGLLIEKSATNQIFPSNAAGTIYQTVRGTSSYGVAVGPDGASSFNLYTEDSAAGQHRVEFKSSTIASIAANTYSIYIKPAGRPYLQFGGLFGAGTWTANIDLSSTGTVFSVSGCTATVTAVGNGSFRVTVTATSTSAAGSFTVRICNDGTFNNIYTGDGRAAFYWFGAQIEQTSYVSSYIPTVAAAATRARDVVTATTASLSISAAAQSIISTFILNTLPASGTEAVVWQVDSGADTAATRVHLVVNSSGQVLLRGAASSATLGTVTAGVTVKVAAGWNGASIKGSVNGAAVVSASDTVAASFTTARYGGAVTAGSGLNGIFVSSTYYPSFIADSLMQSLTA